MKFFGWGKKKSAAKSPACACNDNPAEDAAENINNAADAKKMGYGHTTQSAGCCDKAVNRICCVKVLGSGCKACHELYENTQKAINNMGLSIEVEYVTNMEKVISYGIMTTPALVVNEKVVAMGKVLKEPAIENLFHKLDF